MEGSLGVWAEERNCPRPLVLDLDLAYDATEALGPRGMEGAVDYSAVAAGCKALTAERHRDLMEELCRDLLDWIFATYAPIRRCRLTLHKPGAADGTTASRCTVEAERRGAAWVALGP